jgi:hypothetical protein
MFHVSPPLPHPALLTIQSNIHTVPKRWSGLPDLDIDIDIDIDGDAYKQAASLFPFIKLPLRLFIRI